MNTPNPTGEQNPTGQEKYISAVTPPAPKPPMHSKTFKWTIAGISGLIILIGVFGLGLRVGLHEASFTEDWERDYSQNFGSFTGAPVKHSPQDPFLTAHGVLGSILSISGNDLAIKGSDNNEKTVVVSDDTTIRQNFQSLKLSDLKANDSIIVIGDPDDQGRIEAKFIRVLNQQ